MSTILAVIKKLRIVTLTSCPIKTQTKYTEMDNVIMISVTS